MAKRSYTKKSSKLEDVLKEDVLKEDVELLPEDKFELPSADTWEFAEAEDEPQTTVLVLTKDIGTLNVTGPVSGKLYTFHGAGSKVDIDNEDVEGLLNRINPNNCCSGSVQQPYFILE